MLAVPGLKLIGGLLLLWIGIKLLIENGGENDHQVNSSNGLMTAIRTIIIADFVMSLDNSIAIAAAAKGNMYLVVFGLLLSVPIIIAGSAIILKLMSRYPVIISMGAGLLGWLAGDLIVHDPLLESYLNFQIPYANLLINGGFAAVVVVVGRTLAMRQKTV